MAIMVVLSWLHCAFEVNIIVIMAAVFVCHGCIVFSMITTAAARSERVVTAVGFVPLVKSVACIFITVAFVAAVEIDLKRYLYYLSKNKYDRVAIIHTGTSFPK